MRPLFWTALLLISALSFASDTPSPQALNSGPKTGGTVFSCNGRAASCVDQVCSKMKDPESCKRRFQQDERNMRRELEAATSTCYFLRAYKRERVEGGDATKPVGMTVCTPSARVQFKKAAPGR